MPETARSFIAISLPEAVKAYLRGWQQTLAPKVPGGALRWTRADSAHLTLLFLGEVAASELGSVDKAMRRVVGGVSPFELEVAGLGCFPGFRKPRVVWLGVQGDLPALARIQGDLQRSLELIAPQEKGQRFTPHLTLGRVKRGGAELSQTLREAAQTNDEAPPRWRVHDLALMKSELRPEGAQYHVLRRVPLQRH